MDSNIRIAFPFKAAKIYANFHIKCGTKTGKMKKCKKNLVSRSLKIESNQNIITIIKFMLIPSQQK